MAPRDITTFIRSNLRLTVLPQLGNIQLYLAHPGSGLRRLAETDDAPPPYWAYLWPGGSALAQHLLTHPQVVRGRRVLDLGAGSGVVAIAAAQAGAAEVLAVETDPNGRAALRVNAEANTVAVAELSLDVTRDEPPAVDLVLIGDLFYDPHLAEIVANFLDRCLAAGIEVLVGDIGRTDLPLHRLETVASYPVSEVGAAPAAPPIPGHVFRFRLLEYGRRRQPLPMHCVPVSSQNPREGTRTMTYAMTFSDEAQKVFVTGLKNAHAMENQALSIMRPQVARIENYPMVRQKLEQHIAETEVQIQRLESILGEFGENHSTLKDMALSVVGGMAAITHAFAPDEILKNSFANFAFENFEIAAYNSLITLAQAGGASSAAPILQQNLAEEQAMARWLEQNLETVTLQFAGLKEAGAYAKT